jgi:DNA-binding LacI/PurR family transcriptional regulator
VSGTELKARPRLADVARQAGVSSATASRVLTGSARVSPETRQEVENAIAQLGYVRNRAARSPGSRRVGSIAFVACEDNARVFSEPFFPLMLRSVSRELAARDIQLMLLTVHSPRDYRTAARYLRSGHVDGALLASMHGGRPFDLHGLGIPVVLIGRPFGEGEGDGGKISYVDADNVGGAKMAVQYLLKTGRATVATVAGPPDMAPGVDRLLGYRATMDDAGLADPGLIVFGDFGPISAEHGLYRLLDRRPKIDAVFVASDRMAAGALHALHRTGRRVPEDVAVVGFDDSPLAQHTYPKLTTVRQPVEAMGSRLATVLLALISRVGREPTHVVLDTELIVRQSA